MAIDFDSRDLTPEARAAVMASGLLDNKFDAVMASVLDRRGIAQRADDTLIREPKPKKNRYGNVARPTHYKGSRYDSKAEAEYAAWLDCEIKAGTVAWWLRQIFIPLGPDFGTRVDFLVAIGGFHYQGYAQSMLRIIEAHEVKGVESREFAKVRKLWPKYAPFPLHIIKSGNVEIVNGA